MTALGLSSASRSESVIFPLMGSRAASNDCFEYIPVNVRFQQLTFAIPPWVTNMKSLEISEEVEFHIGIKVGARMYNRGIIMETGWDEALGSAVFRARLLECPSSSGICLSTNEGATHGSFHISIDYPDHLSLKDAICLVLKDSLHLKKGVAVHLSHLFPYFSRISNYPTKDFPLLKRSLFHQIMVQVRESESVLRTVYKKFRGDDRTVEALLATTDLVRLREAMESDTHIGLLAETLAANGDETDPKSPMAYLKTIQSLEKKLYANYNALASLQVSRIAA